MRSLLITNVLVFFLATTHSIIVSRRYSTKVEFDNEETKNDLLGEYKARSLCMCSAKCRKDCRFFGYNNNLKLCRVYRKVYTTQKSNMENGWRYFFNNFLPLDCSDLREDGHTTSGVYDIYPYSTGAHPIRAYCDMGTMNGGWTAIQKRINGFQSFDQKWPEYKNGFGDPEQDYWIGNDVIHQLTKRKNSRLYVSISLTDGRTLFELYDRFSVSNETEKYKLFLAGKPSGTLGDSIFKTGTNGADLSGMFFSTPGTDNDRSIKGVCTQHCRCGWWMNDCYNACLNGPWSTKAWQAPWAPAVMSGKSVTGTKMMIRRH
ncbi:fibroleukin-like [Saccostrea cucullata]|uniref:fibroleukin-like n=1 Tax=Saccostrea cuccullata TaxID=36930 RepID=UPI002ED63F0F